MPEIIVTIARVDLESLLEAARTAINRGADGVEFRFDALSELSTKTIQEIGKWVHDQNINAIATVRSRNQGGFFSGTHHEQISLLTTAAASGFSMVDAESNMPTETIRRLHETCKKFSCQLIVSHHDFSGPTELAEILSQAEQCSELGDIAKVAATTRTFKDVLVLLDAGRILRDRGIRFVLTGIGTFGHLTRVFSDTIGNEFLYASLRKRDELVAGQIDLGTLRRVFSPGGPPGVLGIVGHPIDQSASPLIWNHVFETTGMPFVYLLFPVADAGDLEHCIDLVKTLGIRGFNVTQPYKETILPLLDGVDETAREIGAVNTVSLTDGELIGHNTDGKGVIAALSSVASDFRGKRALVIGAGGAARATIYALLKEGARIAVTNRTPSRAEKVASQFRSDIEIVPPDDVLTKGPSFDVIVNCTPVGSSSSAQSLPIPEGAIRAGQILFDLVYLPLETRFLKTGKMLEARTVDGMKMLVEQAACAFEIWFGKPAPREAFRNAAATFYRLYSSQDATSPP